MVRFSAAVSGEERCVTTLKTAVWQPKENRASKKFYNKCSENSRSQIVFRTDIFRKMTLGVPDLYLSNV